MSENRNLIGVLAAIDQAVEAHPERRDDVAAAFPAYRDPKTPGWFESFEAWVEERSPVETEFPAVDDALKEMADQTPAGAPSERERAETEAAATQPERPSSPSGRRRRALAGLVAAMPERYGPEGTHSALVVEALQQLTTGNSRDEAEEMHRRGSADLPRSSSFQGSLIMMSTDGGNSDPVPILQTQSRPLFGHKIPRVEEFLEPTQWSSLNNEFWESMTPVDGLAGNLPNDEPHCFEEVFAVTPTFKLCPVLEVVSRDLTTTEPPARSLEYRLCPGLEHTHRLPGDQADAAVTPCTNNFVTVDEGAIVNRELGDSAAGGWLTVTTTKRVAFDGTFSGAALPMVAHALGYQDAFEDMVETALALTRR